MSARARVLGWLVLGGCVLTAGCRTTRPWQRENLARPVMAPDAEPDREPLHHHICCTGESAPGRFGAGGGGRRWN